MKLVRVFLLVILILSSSGLRAAGNAHRTCETRYPIVLVHGVNAKNINILNIDYWWGIVGALEDEGATVYVTNQHAFQSSEFRAKEVLKTLLEIRAIHRTGHEKFNIIAHSQGALDARYLISNISLTLPETDPYLPGRHITGAALVNSMTSLAGVNHGCILADHCTKCSIPVQNVVSKAVNAYSRFFFDDEHPDNTAAITNLTKEYMETVFNPNTLDDPSVYYQSWAGLMKYPAPDNASVWATWAGILILDGPNDGFTTIESAKWGNFRGVLTGPRWGAGVNHWALIGHWFGITPWFDAPDFYVSVVRDLKEKGF